MSDSRAELMLPPLAYNWPARSTTSAWRRFLSGHCLCYFSLSVRKRSVVPTSPNGPNRNVGGFRLTTPKQFCAQLSECPLRSRTGSVRSVASGVPGIPGQRNGAVDVEQFTSIESSPCSGPCFRFVLFYHLPKQLVVGLATTLLSLDGPAGVLRARNTSLGCIGHFLSTADIVVPVR
jgi:hypothetical protein